MKSIVILGGSGHAKAVIAAIESTGSYSIEGIVDPRLEIGKCLMGYSVIGNDDSFIAMKKTDYLLALGIGSVRADEKRQNLFNKYSKLGYQFPAVVHHKAIIYTKTKLAKGIQIMSGCLIQPEVEIGENTIINSGSIVEHDCRIGNHCHIAPGAILAGGVIVGNNSFVGLGAKVLPGIKIGSAVTIGAGAVVTHDIPNGKIFVGIPAREIEASHP